MVRAAAFGTERQSRNCDKFNRSLQFTRSVAVDGGIENRVRIFLYVAIIVLNQITDDAIERSIE